MSDPVERMYREAFHYDKPDELSRQDVLDLMDACSIGDEWLRDHAPMEEDAKDMREKADRLAALFTRLCSFPQVALCECGMGYRAGHYGTPEHEFWLLEKEREEGA